MKVKKYMEKKYENFVRRKQRKTTHTHTISTPMKRKRSQSIEEVSDDQQDFHRDRKRNTLTSKVANSPHDTSEDHCTPPPDPVNFPSSSTSHSNEIIEDPMDTDQLLLKVERAMCQIGLDVALSKPTQAPCDEVEEDRSRVLFDRYDNYPEDIDINELLKIVQQELASVEEQRDNARQAGMAQWKQLLERIPYHIALDILAYNMHTVSQDGNHREIIGYFSRDPTRKCQLIFRSLNMFTVPSPNAQRNENGDLYMEFIMRHVRHISVHSAVNLEILDKWMRPPRTTCIENIEIMCNYSTIDRVKLHSLSSSIFSTTRSICAAAISDDVLKFKNLACLTLHSRFSGAHIDNIKQLPAYSLTSLEMIISTPEHIQFLSHTLDHLQNLNELHLRLYTEDMWGNVALILRNSAPRALRHLTIFPESWFSDGDIPVNITPGMFSSTLVTSIEKLGCCMGDLTGLAEFSQLKTLTMYGISDDTQVLALYSALRLVPSLTALNLGFNISMDDDEVTPFTPILHALTYIVNGLPGLQILHLLTDQYVVVSDRDLSQFLVNVARSGVKFYWSMDEEPFTDELYQSFLTVLFSPKLRHLLDKIYLMSGLDIISEDVHETANNICDTIREIEGWQ